MHYPASDGKPLGETEIHAACTRTVTVMLEAHFADDPNVWVNSDIMLYYVEGDPRRVVSPDIYVVRGVPKLPQRRIYALWREGRAPSIVIEVSSRKTRREDVETKRALYRQLGVAEYALFDPLAEYLRPPLQLLRLVDGDYQPVEPNADGRLPSQALGLELAPGALRAGPRLGLYDPAAGQWLRDLREAEAARRAAEAENARLRAELERLRRGA